VDELWEGVGEAEMIETYKAQEGAFAGVRCSQWQ
jgi:hypothetical protein